jgi:uncharacterized DUF497 family protein
MNFEWDENKNRLNIAKHGFDFSDASRIFDSPMLVDLDGREDYGEESWVGIGLLDGSQVGYAARTLSMPRISVNHGLAALSGTHSVPYELA